MIASLRRLRKDDQGAAIIELALSAPILAMLVIGMVDLSMAFSRKLTIEQAAQRGLEKIMQTTENGQVDTTAEAEIEAAADLDRNEVVLTIQQECTNRTTGVRRTLTLTPPVVNPNLNVAVGEESYEPEIWDPGNSCNPSTEIKANYILVVATDEFVPMFPIKFGANAQGRYPITVRVGVRTQ
mgnify:CR=1 FL=1